MLKSREANKKMKNVEKEKLASNMIVSILLAIAYAVGLYLIYNGIMNNIPNTPAINSANYFSTLLIVVGVIGAAITMIKKKMILCRYFISLIFYGAVVKVLEYGLLGTPYGKYLFFGLEGLAVVYIVFITIFTLAKIRR